MKTTLKTFTAIFCIVSLALSAGAQSATEKKSSASDWKELKEFHAVMAQTFHPMEEGDYKPIRERSGEMAEKARLLAESKVPAEFSKPEMLRAIEELKAMTQRLDGMVKSKSSDQDINRTLTATHDTFHKIVGMCQPGDEHQHEHHDHSDPNHKH